MGTAYQSAGAAGAGIPRIADAAQQLIRDGLIRVYLGPLDSDWWRDDNDLSVEAATSILGIGITERGRLALAAAAWTGPRIWRKRCN